MPPYLWRFSADPLKSFDIQPWISPSPKSYLVFIQAHGLQLCRPNSQSFIPTIIARMESLLFSGLLDFISEINAARTSACMSPFPVTARSEEHTSELQSRRDL